ncbi:IS1634 family transposase [Tuanshanicoccus lijuaniae]|uniref:IS1634 family transposase n=1 Tax=Aerococcaceae bacterium zg-1292 TaxID=2774330 RepID=UPI001935ACFB|nr:IS1634 family transposase [Aerococcaceae bacterium zg-1292]
MSQVIYTHKNGTKYVYESTSYYDKEKKQARPKRKLIGKIDPVTGAIVPTQPRGRKPKHVEKNDEKKTGGVRSIKSYGATYLLTELAKKMGVLSDLKEIFPDSYLELLTLMQYLILEPGNSIREFDQWQTKVETELTKDLSSKCVSELFATISEDDKQRFFHAQQQRYINEEYWVFDTTSISTYSDIDYAKYGYNKEDDKLKQVNLGLVVGETSRIPVMYRLLPGNIVDSKTIETLLSLLDEFPQKMKKLVLDRGFYKERNIQMLCEEGVEFVAGGKRGVKYIDEVIERLLPEIKEIEHYSTKEKLYIGSEKISHFRASETSHYPVTVHVYHDEFQQYQQKTKLMEDLDELLTLLNEDEKSRKEIESNNRGLMTYVTLNPEDNRYSLNTEVIKKRIATMGTFVLLSNSNQSSQECLRIYRDKDIVEKKFQTLKNDLEMRRLRTHGQETTEGKMFVQYLTVVVESYLREQMRGTKLDEKYTLKDLLEEIKSVYTYIDGGGNYTLAEVTNKQAKIFERLGILHPSFSIR